MANIKSFNLIQFQWLKKPDECDIHPAIVTKRESEFFHK